MKKLLCGILSIFMSLALAYGATFIIDNAIATSEEVEANAVLTDEDFWFYNDYRDTSFSLEGDNIYIADAADLAQFAYLVNAGNTCLGKTITLTSNIDLSAHYWSSIGCGITSISDGWFNYLLVKVSTTAFQGTFNGNGYKISGINTLIDVESFDRVYGYNAFQYVNAYYSGLFGKVNGGTIKNLIIDGSEYFAESLVEFLSGTAFTMDEIYVGGLVGWAETSTIENVYVYRSLSARVSRRSESCLGGVAGYLKDCTIKDCFSYEIVRESNSSSSYTSEYHKIGGIVGEVNNTDIFNCFNYGDVSSGSYENVYIGGILGYCETENIYVENCGNFWQLSTSASVNSCGGIVGNLSYNSYVKNCVNYGNINGMNATSSTKEKGTYGENGYGGIVGFSYGTVEQCINYGDLVGKACALGGIVGLTSAGEIKNNICFSLTISGYWKTSGSRTYYRYGPIHGDVYVSRYAPYNNQEATFSNNYFSNNIFTDMKSNGEKVDLNGTFKNIYNLNNYSFFIDENNWNQADWKIADSIEKITDEVTDKIWIMTPLVCSYYKDVQGLEYTILPIAAIGKAEFVWPNEDLKIIAYLEYTYTNGNVEFKAQTKYDYKDKDKAAYMYFLRGIERVSWGFYLELEEDEFITSIDGIELVKNSLKPSYWKRAAISTIRNGDKIATICYVGGKFYDVLITDRWSEFSLVFTGKSFTKYFGLLDGITGGSPIDRTKTTASDEDDNLYWRSKEEPDFWVPPERELFGNFLFYDYNFLDHITYGNKVKVEIEPLGGYKFVGVYYYKYAVSTNENEGSNVEDTKYEVDWDEDDSVEILDYTTDENTNQGEYVKIDGLDYDQLGTYKNDNFLIQGIGTTTIYFVFDYIEYEANVAVYDVVNKDASGAYKYKSDLYSYEFDINTTMSNFVTKIGIGFYGYKVKYQSYDIDDGQHKVKSKEDWTTADSVLLNGKNLTTGDLNNLFTFLNGTAYDPPNNTTRWFDLIIVRQAIDYKITIHNMAERYNNLNQYEEYVDGYGGTAQLGLYNGYNVPDSSDSVLTPNVGSSPVVYSATLQYSLNKYFTPTVTSTDDKQKPLYSIGGDNHSGLLVKFASKPGFALSGIKAVGVDDENKKVDVSFYTLPTREDKESTNFSSKQVEADKTDKSLITLSTTLDADKLYPFADGEYILNMEILITNAITSGVITEDANDLHLYAYFDIKAYYMQGEISGLCTGHGVNDTCSCFGEDGKNNWAATFKSEVITYNAQRQVYTKCLENVEKYFKNGELYYSTYFAPIQLRAYDFEDSLNDSKYKYLSDKKFVGWYVVKLKESQTTNNGDTTVSYTESGSRYLLSTNKEYVFVNEPLDLDKDGQKDDLFTNFKIIAQYVSFEKGVAPTKVTKKIVNGVEKATYTIETPKELAWVSYQVASGADDFKNDVIQLANHLDMSGISLLPIGGLKNSFKGTFDGCGYVIEDLRLCNETRDSYVSDGVLYFVSSYEHSVSEIGLFGYVEGATIKNITLVGGSVTGYSNVGAIAGKASNSTFENVNNFSCEVNVKEINFCDIYGNKVAQYIENFTISEGAGNDYVANDNAQYDSENKIYLDSIFSKKQFEKQSDFAGVVGQSGNQSKFVKVSNHAQIIYSSDEAFAFAIAGLTNAYSYSDDQGKTFKNCSFELCYTDCSIGTNLNNGDVSGGTTFSRFVQGSFDAKDCYYRISSNNSDTLYLYNATLSRGGSYSGNYYETVELDSNIWLNLYGKPVLRDFYWA